MSETTTTTTTDAPDIQTGDVEGDINIEQPETETEPDE